MKKKEVRCYTHHSLDGGWADVWISYKDRRRKRHFGPTLMTRASVVSDLEITSECARDNPEIDWSGDIEHHLMVLAELSRAPYVVTTECGVGIPSVHTNAAELTRREVESMLTYLVRQQGVRAPLRFSWNKPDVMVHPV